jgi:hypothetical protein
MLRNNAFLPAPEIIEGRKVDVEYVGPLARSQRMEESVAIDRLYQLAMQVGQIDPTIMDNINHDEAVRMRSKLLGVPKTIMRGVDEVGEIRQQRMMQQQAQQQMMIQQQQAEMALTQSKAMKEMGNPETQEGFEKAEDRAREEGFIE